MKPALSTALSGLLPTPDQTLLLRACLCSAEAGRKAYAAWSAQQGERRYEPQEEFVKSLLPLLFSALRRSGAEVDPLFLTILRTAALREELRTKTYRRICREVFSTLTTTAIPYIVLRGATLSDTVYDDPALRHSHDIDILLGESDPSRTISLLAALGFIRSGTAETSEWSDIQLIHTSGLPLVLHRHLFDIAPYNTDSENIWARSRLQTIADGPVRVLSPADALLHVCGHASYDLSRESPRWACDAWFLVDRCQNLDWEVLLHSAARSRLALPLSVMLDYLAEELRAPIPSGVLTRLHAIASRAETVDCELALWGARVGTRVRLKDIIGLARDWHTRIRVLKWLLLPSPAYLRSIRQMPRPWLLPFYYAYRPLRYTIRYICWLYRDHIQFKLFRRVLFPS
jgi:hypothetical protein